MQKTGSAYIPDHPLDDPTLAKAYEEELIAKDDVYEIGKLVDGSFEQRYPTCEHEGGNS